MRILIAASWSLLLLALLGSDADLFIVSATKSVVPYVSPRSPAVTGQPWTAQESFRFVRLRQNMGSALLPAMQPSGGLSVSGVRRIMLPAFAPAAAAALALLLAVKATRPHTTGLAKGGQRVNIGQRRADDDYTFTKRLRSQAVSSTAMFAVTGKTFSAGDVNIPKNATSSAAPSETYWNSDIKQAWTRAYASAKQVPADYEIEDIEGSIPTGLSGSIFRNGPGNFERGGERFKHILVRATRTAKHCSKFLGRFR